MEDYPKWEGETYNLLECGTMSFYEFLETNDYWEWALAEVED